jgi:anhydro-N-acetylmuramic acid kinase
MGKTYTALGLMSGTSMDGVDASIVQTDGENIYKAISNKYFEYNKNLYANLTDLRGKINASRDLKAYSKDLKLLEKELTIFHANLTNEIINKSNTKIDFIGFHGQTIFHNADEKISIQLGDAKLLSQLTKKKVIYNFRKNDLKKGGQGAPLVPIFHKMLEKKFIRKGEADKFIEAVHFVNLGGVANRTSISDDLFEDFPLSATDIGPGMCLIDKWIRDNSQKKYDESGSIAKLGKINEIILNQALENFWDSENYSEDNSQKITSYDVSDFNSSFVRGLSLEDGAATLVEYTAKIIYANLFFADDNLVKVILCGGGRKNNFLFKRIEENFNNIPVKLIDDYGVDGDFIESQAFGYLAVRSYIKLPISFPKTTNVKAPCIGGVLVKNY